MATRIYERDTDALLLRLLRTRPAAFCSSFVAAILGRCPTGEATIEGQTKHVGSTGRIDLVVAYPNGPRLLIENKIDAGFSITSAGRGQLERYRSTVEAWRSKGVEACSVLLAPERYLAGTRSAHMFDHCFSYEHLRPWVSSVEDSALLNSAILQAESPYEPVPDASAGQFFSSMRRLIVEHFPDLVMKREPNAAGVRPLASRTVYFDVPRTLRIHPDLPRPKMSLQCWDSSARSASVKILLTGLAHMTNRFDAPLSLVDVGGYVRRAAQSLGVVIDTPRLDTQRSFANQFDDVIEALQASLRLQKWWNDHSDELRAAMVRSSR
jgi:hypothetical protein